MFMTARVFMTTRLWPLLIIQIIHTLRECVFISRLNHHSASTVESGNNAYGQHCSSLFRWLSHILATFNNVTIDWHMLVKALILIVSLVRWIWKLLLLLVKHTLNWRKCISLHRFHFDVLLCIHIVLIVLLIIVF